MWTPWRGCHRYSEGCKYCYIHKGDARRGVDTSEIVKTEKFTAPVDRNKKGEYRMKGGQTVYVCFSSDFLLPDADGWRGDCWRMMKERPDLSFLFLTKRIDRLADCLPPDWGGGWENVTVGCTVEDQRTADYRLPIFAELPVVHKNVICQPMLGAMDIERWLGDVELVVAGGESDRDARPLDYDWILSLREQCVRTDTDFQFRQCGTHFIRDGKAYTLNVRQLCSQARKAGIDYTAPRDGGDINLITGEPT